MNRTDGSLLYRDRICVSIFIEERAFGGRRARNNRAVLPRGEKGLNFARTSVRNRVIMVENMETILVCKTEALRVKGSNSGPASRISVDLLKPVSFQTRET